MVQYCYWGTCKQNLKADTLLMQEWADLVACTIAEMESVLEKLPRWEYYVVSQGWLFRA